MGHGARARELHVRHSGLRPRDLFAAESAPDPGVSAVVCASVQECPLTSRRARTRSAAHAMPVGLVVVVASGRTLQRDDSFDESNRYAAGASIGAAARARNRVM